MTRFPASPRPLKYGIVLIDPDTSSVRHIIVLQYNPDTLTRTLQPKTGATGSDGGDLTEAMRLKGPQVETIKLEAAIDSTDQLELGTPPATAVGIHSRLAMLELIVYPSSSYGFGCSQSKE